MRIYENREMAESFGAAADSVQCGHTADPDIGIYAGKANETEEQ